MHHMTNSNAVYIVTGAGSGMGRAITRSLLADGQRVVLVGRREEALRETAGDQAGGSNASIVAADLSTPEGAEKLASSLTNQAVRAFVSAAGGQGDFYKQEFTVEEAEADWNAALRKNLFTAVLPIEAVLSNIEKGGRIVLIGSTSGVDGKGGPYATAKAALHGYCRDLARRVGERSVCANVVAPGFVADTEFFEAGGFRRPGPMIDRVASETLVGRVGTSDDIVGCVRWLLSDSGGWVTGQIISPNGGQVLVG